MKLLIHRHCYLREGVKREKNAFFWMEREKKEINQIKKYANNKNLSLRRYKKVRKKKEKERGSFLRDLQR